MADTLRDHLFRIRTQVLGEPLNKGRRLHYLARYIRWQALAKYGKSPWTITFENGLRSLVLPYPDHDSGEKNIWTRNNDWYDNELVRRVLRPGDQIVDAGCNVGNRTWALADLIGGALMIDAGATAIQRTRENLFLNGLSEANYLLVNKAVGASPGTVSFTDLGGASTQNMVLAPGEKPVGVRTVELEMTTIDREVERHRWKPTYMKLDVEGQDLAALNGAMNTLRGGSVRLVMFESVKPEDNEEFSRLFASIGWTMFALDRDTPTLDPEHLHHDLNLFGAPPAVFEMLRSKPG